MDETQVHVMQERDSTCHAVMTSRVEADFHRIFTLFEREDYDNIFEIFKVGWISSDHTFIEMPCHITR